MTSGPWLPQRELDRDLDDHVDRFSTPARGREPPLAYGGDGALVQAGSEALQDLDIADAAVASHHDLHHDVARDPAPSRFVRVVRFDLAQQAGGFDAAAWPEGTAAGAATRAV